MTGEKPATLMAPSSSYLCKTCHYKHRSLIPNSKYIHSSDLLLKLSLEALKLNLSVTFLICMVSLETEWAGAVFSAQVTTQWSSWHWMMKWTCLTSSGCCVSDDQNWYRPLWVLPRTQCTPSPAVYVIMIECHKMMGFIVNLFVAGGIPVLLPSS